MLWEIKLYQFLFTFQVHFTQLQFNLDIFQ